MNVQKNKRIISYCAFFDVDGTILNTRTVLSFLEYMRDSWSLSSDEVFLEYQRSLFEKLVKNVPREDVNRFYYTGYRGKSVTSIMQLAEKWFDDLERREGIYNESILGEIAKHRRLGADIVLVTGSFPHILKPLVKRIPVDAILCSRPKTRGDVFTGELEGVPCIGLGKAQAVIEFSRRGRIDLKSAFGYGDDDTDAPMLNLLGHPCMITPSLSYREEVGKYVKRLVGDKNESGSRINC